MPKILLEKETNDPSREAPPKSLSGSPSREPREAPPEEAPFESLSGGPSREYLGKPLLRASREAPPESLSGSPSREPLSRPLPKACQEAPPGGPSREPLGRPRASRQAPPDTSQTLALIFFSDDLAERIPPKPGCQE